LELTIPEPSVEQENAVAAELAEGDPRVLFVVKLGQALHRYGIPTHRLEAGMDLVLDRLGMQGQFFATPTGIFASFGPPEEQRTSLIRVQTSESDLEKLAELDELINEVIREDVSVTEGLQRIEAITSAPSRYGVWLTTASFTVGSCMFARFLGGGWRELAVTAIVGLILGGLGVVMGRTENTTRVIEPVAAVISAATAVLFAHIFHPLSVYIATLASLIVMVPGLTVTVAIRELATRNLVAGTARLTGALLTFFQLGFGVALGWQVARLLPTPTVFTGVEPLPTWTVAVALAIAPLTFGILFRARPRDFKWIMLSCLISFAGSRWGASILGPELGVFIGAALVGAASNLYARLVDRPSAIPLVPGMMMLVPGSIGFGSLAKFLEKDILSGVGTAFSMVLVAVALVTGLLVANVIVPPRKIL
jgi:uncharacterized membrane protein YjjP (DUF1212 family)